MRALFRIGLSMAVLTWCAMAQRGGGGHAGGGGGAHFSGGGGFHGSVGGGGFHSSYGGVRGSYGGSAFRGGYGARGFGYGGYGRGFYGRGFGYGRFGYGRFGYGWPYYLGWGYPWWGYGGYWPSYYYGYPYSYYYPDTYADSGYGYSDPGDSAYGYGDGSYDPQAQTMTPAQAMAPPPTSYQRPVHSVTHTYDEYGQEVPSAGSGSYTANSSPIYLIAEKGGEIQAAASYWVTGQTLHYITTDRQEKQVALGSIDRALTQQLNRERHVTLTLPNQ